MGEVYKARDTRIQRVVAVKISAEQFGERFAREAHAVGQLNHPSICTLYDVGPNYLVMEYIEGPTLAEQIAGGAIGLPEALPLARQIAEALEAAHEKGIVHRDLKPANIKVTGEGKVKVLDFGLAKAFDNESSPGSSVNSPTLTLASTRAGVILGTAGYMSPEQARGTPADKRADIWSYGVVLFEMLTGQVVFTGETVSDTLAAVLRAEVQWAALPPETPPAIRRLLRRCLERDRKKRLPDIAVARLEIDEALATPVEAPPAPPVPVLPPRRALPPWLIAAASLAIAIVAGVAWWQSSRPLPGAPLIRLNAEMDADVPLNRSNLGAMLAISPDARRLALTLKGPDNKVRIYTRLLHQSQVTPLAGTENAASPFFSPDSQWIAFNADGKLKKISVEGGAAVTLCEAQSIRGASWGDDGNIVMALGPSGALSRISSAGGPVTQVTRLGQGERTHRFPHVLPGSKMVLFTPSRSIGNYDDANIDVVALETGARKTVHRGGFSARYLATSSRTGYLAYVHHSTLFVVPFDPGRLAPTGVPVPLVEDISGTASAGGDFDVARNGTLVYVAGKGGQSGWIISWMDNAGKVRPLQPSPALFFTPRVSPDGKRVAFSLSNGSGTDLWVKDLARDIPSRLSFLGGENRWPVWTPDGKYIVFQSDNAASSGLYWIRSDGAGEVQRLSDGKSGDNPSSFSPDGKRLAFSLVGNAGTYDIYTAAIEGDPSHPRLGKPEPFLVTPFVELRPAFSPDGHWLAYASNESGTFEVYVRPFPGPGGRWQISTGGGFYPLWSHAGGELLFVTSEGRVMAADYSVKGDSFIAGRQRPWSEVPVLYLPGVASYDLAPDGRHIAALQSNNADKQNPITHVTFLLNFFDELRRRVPAGGS
jgi:serine/threonine protein kinase/Tol biopolymer transport system component